MKIGLKIAAIGMILVSGLLQACKTPESQAKSVESLLESDGSGTWTRVKVTTRINNYAVFLGPDGKYYAFNINEYNSNQTKEQFLAAATVYSGLSKSVDTYQQYQQTGSYSYSSSYCPSSYSTDVSITCSVSGTDEYGYVTGYNVTETDYGWVQVREDIYTDYATGLVFEVGDTASKDLETVSAAIEASSNALTREALVSGYGLSESRASEIASLAKSWQSIEKSRAMTSKDLTQFQSKVFGSDLGSLKKAAEKAAKGDNKEYDSLIKKAAQLNDISPEQAKSILKDFVN